MGITYIGRGPYKSQGRGIIQITADSTNYATISAVDTAKTQLTFLGSTTSPGSNAAARLYLTNPTTITADSTESGVAATIYVPYEYKERY